MTMMLVKFRFYTYTGHNQIQKILRWVILVLAVLSGILYYLGV